MEAVHKSNLHIGMGGGRHDSYGSSGLRSEEDLIEEHQVMRRTYVHIFTHVQEFIFCCSACQFARECIWKFIPFGASVYLYVCVICGAFPSVGETRSHQARDARATRHHRARLPPRPWQRWQQRPWSWRRILGAH